jgi:hypothetical protein
MKRAAAYLCGVIATAAAFSQAMTGCNTIGDIAPTDASASDVVRGDAAPGACAVDPPPVMKYLDSKGVETLGDWSCYAPDAGFFFPLGLDGGDAGDDASDAGDDASDAGDDASDAGDDASVDAGPAPVRFHLSDFVALTAVPSAHVDVFFNNTLGTPDFSGITTDMGDAGPTTPGIGEFFFPASGTPLIAYRVNARIDAGGGLPDIKPLIWLDIQSPKPGETFLANSITQQSYDLLGGGIVGNTALDPQKMTVTIGVRDCQYRDVLGGIIELIDDATGQPLVSGEGDFRAQYFGPNGFPEPTCKHTVAQQSLYAAVNVPSDRSITVRASGRMSDSDTAPVVLGTRKLPAVPGFIIIVRPYRLTPPP